MICMDVDSVLAEVPVNVVALIDDTDFKSREESVVYNQAGLDLVWNFVTTAGAYTQTAVTPTTGGGDYDWTNQGNGMYSIGIPDTGGASINNDTEGFGWFTGYATGILPWTGPIICFRASGLNDKLVDSAYDATRGLAGTALPAAAADAAGGLPISDAGGLDLDTQVKTNIDAILADTNELQTDDVPTLIAALPTAVENRTEMDSNSTQLAAIVADTNELQTDDVPGLIAALNDLSAADVNAEVDTALSDYDPPTKAEQDAAFTEIKGATWDSGTDTLEHIRNKQTDIETDTQDLQTQVGAAGAGLTALGDARLANLDATVSSRGTADPGDAMTVAVGGIQATSFAASAIDAAALASDAGDEIAAAVWSAVTRTLTSAAQFQIKKGTELVAFPFVMTDDAAHAPATGKTVTATRSIDGAAFAACTNAVVEISGGWYKITLSAADLNGNTIALRFTATGCDDLNITIVTQAQS